MEEVKNIPIPLNSSFSKAHVEGRVLEIKGIRNNIEGFYSKINKDISGVSGYFEKHLWLDRSMLSEVTDSLLSSQKEVDKLLKRVTSLESGFKQSSVGVRA